LYEEEMASFLSEIGPELGSKEMKPIAGMASLADKVNTPSSTARPRMSAAPKCTI